MSEHKYPESCGPEHIWLSPLCEGESHDGRVWCSDNQWPYGCEDCGSPAVEYERCDVVDALRAELKAAQKERDEWKRAYGAVENGWDHLKAELDRMRTAMEVRTEYIHFPHVPPEFQDRNRRSAYAGGYAQGWAGKPLSRVYDADYMQCAYNAGHRAGNAEAEDLIERGLNPQPAQQEKA